MSICPNKQMRGIRDAFGSMRPFIFHAKGEKKNPNTREIIFEAIWFKCGLYH